MIQQGRIKTLNDRPIQKGHYVLYWMQASQRAVCNHALEYAIRQANDLSRPVLCLFGLTDRFPEANERHYAFMLQGLKEVHEALYERGIRFLVLHDSPEHAALQFSQDASMVVTDRGYLGIQRSWRRHLADHAPCLVVQVESDVVVPVEVASEKEAYSAAVLRPRIKKHLKGYLVPLKTTPVKKDSLALSYKGLDLQDIRGALRGLSLDGSVSPVETFHGGRKEAMKLLRLFVSQKLKYYEESRNDPSADYGSHMSPYLHFGQIAALEIAIEIRRARGKAKAAKEAFLEELIVRRELSMNFVYYNPHYNSYEALPSWARETLKAHEKDKREHLYNRATWEAGRTHDPYWNAAQREMILTGKMHNYMRMYWGKKILEWSKTPQEAFRTALYLNNKYELDGRDPNGFAGVAWCFGKHDRAWSERPVFGKVRYMNAAGLRRKFDIEAYVRRCT
jgi:deoxyribodipyrimidine photo-lyase